MTAPRLEVYSQASADSTLDLNAPVGKPNGKSKSTPSTGLSLPTDFLMPDSLKMSDGSEAKNLDMWIASRRVFPARTSQTVEASQESAPASLESVPVFSRKSYVSSTKFSPHGWCLKTFRPCSIRTIAATLKRSSGPLPNAIMWDREGCLTLNISESPRNAAAFSWSRVLDAHPQPSSWLTPDSWNLYLARLDRSQSHGSRMLGLPILCKRRTRRVDSLWVLPFSLLTRTDGIRTLSGSERLALQGFEKDWMTPTLRKLSPQEMRSVLSALSGSRKKSSPRRAGDE